MGLFRRKKKVPEADIPDLPDFPEFPGMGLETPDINEPELEDMPSKAHKPKQSHPMHKQSHKMEHEPLNIPQRKKLKFPKLSEEHFELPSLTPVTHDLTKIKKSINPHHTPRHHKPMPPPIMRPPTPSFEAPISHRSTKPLFVQIENYNSAQQALNQIKTNLHQAQSIISTLEKLKTKEDEEIKEWQNKEKIKEKSKKRKLRKRN